jgi:hypothetical protein
MGLGAGTMVRYLWGPMGAPRQPNFMNDFLAWARISARLWRRPPAERVRIIREAGAASSWSEADSHWFEVLLGDVRAGRLDRLDRYTALCAQALQEGEPPAGPCDELRARAGGPFGSGSRPSAPSFAQKLTPPRTVQTPEDDQLHTGVYLDDKREEALATAMALDWPLAQFSWLSATMAHAPERAEAIWETHGIRSDGARRAVLELWEERLSENPELRRSHEELRARYLEALQSHVR